MDRVHLADANIDASVVVLADRSCVQVRFNSQDGSQNMRIDAMVLSRRENTALNRRGESGAIVAGKRGGGCKPNKCGGNAPKATLAER